jgi:hypothetical protein
MIIIIPLDIIKSKNYLEDLNLFKLIVILRKNSINIFYINAKKTVKKHKIS